MTCEKCPAPATFHYTDRDKSIERHLCDPCACSEFPEHRATREGFQAGVRSCALRLRLGGFGGAADYLEAIYLEGGE